MEYEKFDVALPTTTSEEGTCLIFLRHAALIVQSKRTRSGSSRSNVGGLAYVAEVVGLICQKGSNGEGEHEGDERTRILLSEVAKENDVDDSNSVAEVSLAAWHGIGC